MHDPEAFGQAIRAARTSAGMTLADAAAMMGVSKQTLSNLEKATGSVGLAIALRVARELGVGVFAVQPGLRETARQALIEQAAPPGDGA
jgi:transcriptional regulator with XRE-family HTH domain